MGFAGFLWMADLEGDCMEYSRWERARPPINFSGFPLTTQLLLRMRKSSPTKCHLVFHLWESYGLTLSLSALSPREGVRGKGENGEKGLMKTYSPLSPYTVTQRGFGIVVIFSYSPPIMDFNIFIKKPFYLFPPLFDRFYTFSITEIHFPHPSKSCFPICLPLEISIFYRLDDLPWTAQGLLRMYKREQRIRTNGAIETGIR